MSILTKETTAEDDSIVFEGIINTNLNNISGACDENPIHES